MTRKELLARALAELTGRQPSTFEQALEALPNQSELNKELPLHEEERLMAEFRKNGPGILARMVRSNPFFTGSGR